jgi:hypothetical protein
MANRTVRPRRTWIRTGRRAGGKIVNAQLAALILGVPVARVLELVPRHVPGKHGHVWLLESDVVRLLPPEQRRSHPLLQALYSTPPERNVDPPDLPAA